MIIPQPDTTTRQILSTLLDAQEHYTLTTGRVLTLIVSAAEEDNVDAILSAVRDASHEHPSRVLMVISGDTEAPTGLDAELRVGGEAGASEMVVMRLHGALADEAEAVVTPLLLPDTPIVAWWPARTPESPADDPIGSIAQRRITDTSRLHASRDEVRTALSTLRTGYTPGDSDMVWAGLTLWRGIVASALDRQPFEPIESVDVSGPATSAAPDIAAGWLADRLGVAVRRTIDDDDNPEWFPVRRIKFHRRNNPVTVEVHDAHTVRVAMPGSPEWFVAMSRRSVAEVLSEELRHLEADTPYAKALRALTRVNYC